MTPFEAVRTAILQTTNLFGEKVRPNMLAGGDRFPAAVIEVNGCEESPVLDGAPYRTYDVSVTAYDVSLLDANDHAEVVRQIEDTQVIDSDGNVWNFISTSKSYDAIALEPEAAEVVYAVTVTFDVYEFYNA